MSDKKRNRKNNFKDNKRTILLAKKDEREDNGSLYQNADAPKLLLKAKEKPAASSAPNPPSISIATREPSTNPTNSVKIAPSNNNASDSSTSSSSAAAPPPSAPLIKESSLAGKEATAPAVNIEQIKTPKMSRPVTLVTDHYQIESSPLQFLQETNSHFHVVGVIGTQGTGKSTLLNMLSTDKEAARNQPVEYFIHQKRGVFNTKPSAENLVSSIPTTEGIQMYVTSDRMILLDCSPILCNPYKKDYVLNEIDDLKLVIFMLCVCQTLLVVEEDPINLNLLRLLSCAEMMKPTLDKDKSMATESLTIQDAHYPRIMFVQNMAEPRHFLPAAVERQQEIYKQCMKQSRLRIFVCGSQPIVWQPRHDILPAAVETHDPQTESIPPPARRLEKVLPVNTFLFPRIQPKDTPAKFNGQSDIASIVKQFQHRIVMGRRLPFPGANPYTEKNWWQMAVATWESHKNNYFLRKYESEQASRAMMQ